MVQVYLAAAWITLAVFDGYATVKLIRRLGLQAELNPIIRKLVLSFGLKKGVALGVGVPSLAVATLLFWFPILLAIAVGMRIMLSLSQIVQLRLHTS